MTLKRWLAMTLCLENVTKIFFLSNLRRALTSRRWCSLKETNNMKLPPALIIQFFLTFVTHILLYLLFQLIVQNSVSTEQYLHSRHTSSPDVH